jgi:hypothetical protein
VPTAKTILTVLLALPPLAAAAPAALAQAPPATNFGGGAAPSTSPRGPGLGDATASFRTTRSGGAITVLTKPVVRCRPRGTGSVELRGGGRISADGAFTARLSGRSSLTRGFTGRATMTGRVSGGRVTGTVRVRLFQDGRRVCQGSVSVAAVSAQTLGTAPAAPSPGATLMAPIASPTRYLGGSFVLRVAGDGRRIVATNGQAFTRCRRSRFNALSEPNYSPGFPIAPDGSFVFTERYTLRYSDALERVTYRVEGRFVAGGATGTVRVSSVVRSRRTRRTVDACESGPLAFSAVP